MSGHERRIPWVWARIVRACSALTPFQKLFYDEVRGLSNGRGATTSASALGGRLGVSRATIERARHELKRFGLLRTIDLGPGRAIPWFPELPDSCRPRHKRLDDDTVQRLADLLADHIGRIAPERAQTAITREGGSGSEPPSRAGLREGGPPSSVRDVPAPNARGPTPFDNRESSARGERGERGERGTESKAGIPGEAVVLKAAKEKP